jgi:hypothetical protein
MAYTKNTLISRAGYSGFGDWWDSFTDAVGSGLKFYGQQQQQAGAAAAQQQQNKDLTAALLARQGGIGTETLLLVGGVGLAALLLLRKRGS